MSRLVLLAASGLAAEVVSAIRAAGCDEIVGVLDDDPRRIGTRFGQWTISGSVDDVREFRDAAFVVCAGSGRARAAIVARAVAAGVEPDDFAAIVDPTVHVPEGCSVGAGSIVLAQTVLTANVSVGAHVVVMPHVVLTHDCVVDDFATICAGTVLGGGVRVESGAYLGMNSSVRENVTIGRGSVLGMGAVALSDVPAGETRIGCPAVRLEKLGVA
ncbi:MAG: acetyltransferase [Rhodococcus sp. (in: high G+C Gram-positive bacteria)]